MSKTCINYINHTTSKSLTKFEVIIDYFNKKKMKKKGAGKSYVF